MGELWDEMSAISKNLSSEEQKTDARVEIRNYFADRLDKGIVTLGPGLSNMDTERKKIDTVVIHHTSSDEPYSLKYLNAVHLLNIYVPYFRKPTADNEKNFQGMPLQSGHFYKGKQVFWGYHWFVNFNGQATRILNDNELGWHAGNWDINRRSVGICLDGDFINKNPSRDQLNALKKIISEHYSHANNKDIIGHKDAKEDTDCPGNTFMKWRLKLLSH